MADPTRRSFLATAALASSAPTGIARRAAAASTTPGTGRAKRMLILGGTRFLGPQIVLAAEALGYEVTLFNRGKSDAERFARLEQRIGDRDTGDLRSLERGEWDVVVDTSGYAPSHVAATAALLRDRVASYVFVSTISVYADQSGPVVGEDTPVATVPDEVAEQATTIRAASRHYGAMKARCEQAAEAAMPGRVAILRPGLIVGPEDSSDRFTYWPVRIARGGEVLAPGDPEQEVQFVDVRDLGVFCAKIAHAREHGVWNTVGFPFRLSMQELLHGCKVALNADCSFTWVSQSFLQEQRVRPYVQMPLWLPAAQRGHIDNRRAIASGLSFRSVADTIRDTERWYAAEAPAREGKPRAGIPPEREKELLEAWRAAGR